MRHRGNFSIDDRNARSQLAKLINSKRLLCGSLVTMARTCGNPRCKCVIAGQKHVSLYLSIQDGKTRKMICIPKKWEAKIAHEKMQLVLTERPNRHKSINTNH